MTTGVVQLQTTLPDEQAARQLAATLVGERLAACVQVLGPAHSTYRWQDRVDTATEWLCLIKAPAAHLPHLLSRLRALHPYDTPEILVLPVIGGDPAYLRWVEESVGGEQGEGNREK